MTRIALAADHPHLVPTIAKWHWESWGGSVPGGSIEAWTQELEHFAQRTGIPLLLIAMVNSVPVGSLSLVEHDMTRTGSLSDSTPPTRWRDLGPWLSSLYVVPEYRRRGIGRALVASCCMHARRFGAKRLYLYSTIGAF